MRERRWFDPFRSLLSLLVPASEAAPDGGAPPPPEGGPPLPDIAQIAAQLEQANQRIRDMEGNFDTRVREAAQDQLLELFGGPPEGGYVPEPGTRNAPDPGDPGLFSRGEGGGEHQELTPEDVRAELRRELAARDDQASAYRLQSELDALQPKYPRMDRFRVLTFLADQGERADQVNLDALCRISHEHAQRNLDAYAENYHRQRLGEIQTNSPPPVPPAGTGQPTAEQPKVTRANARDVLAEGLRKLGWK